jgi:hypothetical protein
MSQSTTHTRLDISVTGSVAALKARIIERREHIEMAATLPDLVADAEQNGSNDETEAGTNEAGTNSGRRQTKQARQKELLRSAVEHRASTTQSEPTLQDEPYMKQIRYFIRSFPAS